VEDRISMLQDKINIKEKNQEYLDERLKSCEKVCKNFTTPSKYQTCRSWALKEEKRCKSKV
jgi:hypothetical protein